MPSTTENNQEVDGPQQLLSPGTTHDSLSVSPRGDVFLSIGDRSNSVSTNISDVLEKPQHVSTVSPVSTWNEERATPESNSRRDGFHFGIYQGIHLGAPFYMIGLSFSGIIASISHHSYYLSLHGDQVGNETKQQWSLRFGTAFAYITQIFFVASVGVAYTQWLWRTISRTDISIETLDDAFEADAAIVSLLNKELIWKFKVGAFLAAICWCLQIPSLITPATLSVVPTIRVSNETAPVRSLDMYGVNQTKRFALSADANKEQDLLFLGPRTVISRLVTATATEGEILPIVPPFANSTYTVDFFGPGIQCEPANSTVATIVQEIREESMMKYTTGDIKPIENYYHAIVPDLTQFGNPSLPHMGVQASSQIRMQQPTHSSNEIWMVYSRYVPGFGQSKYENYYSICKLFNASYNINVTFAETNQSVTNTSIKFMNFVDYPKEESRNTTETRIQHSYSAFMWAISDLLVGTMSTFNATSKDAHFSEIRTQISYTSLIGSKDLRVFFDTNRKIISPNRTASDQTREDVRLAQNQTLDFLIEQLAFNVTMSFMNSPLLSPPINKTVEMRISINTYSYTSKYLFLPYGLAIIFALIANIFGAYAFWDNKASHSRSFSAKFYTTNDGKIEKVIKDEGSVRLPLSGNLKKLRVQFCMQNWEFKKV